MPIRFSDCLTKSWIECDQCGKESDLVSITNEDNEKTEEGLITCGMPRCGHKAIWSATNSGWMLVLIEVAMYGRISHTTNDKEGDNKDDLLCLCPKCRGLFDAFLNPLVRLLRQTRNIVDRSIITINQVKQEEKLPRGGFF